MLNTTFMKVTAELVAGQKHQQRIKSSAIEVQEQNAVPDNVWESQGLDPWGPGAFCS